MIEPARVVIPSSSPVPDISGCHVNVGLSWREIGAVTREAYLAAPSPQRTARRGIHLVLWWEWRLFRMGFAEMSFPVLHAGAVVGEGFVEVGMGCARILKCGGYGGSCESWMQCCHARGLHVLPLTQ